MARSIPATGHRRRNSRQRFPLHMDSKVWSSSASNYGSRSSIWVTTLPRTKRSFWHTTLPYHCLPSSCKRTCGAYAPSAKIRIKCHATDRWSDCLPIVLLGMRAAWREDFGATTAEMVYGESLRLPGEFLAPKATGTRTSSQFVKDLKNHFHSLKPVQGTLHGDRKTFVFKDLSTTSHVFLRLHHHLPLYRWLMIDPTASYVARIKPLTFLLKAKPSQSQ